MNTFIVAMFVTIAAIGVFVAGLFSVECITNINSDTPTTQSCEPLTFPTYSPPETSGGVFDSVFGTIGRVISFVGATMGWFFNIVTFGIAIPTPILAILSIISFAVMIYIILRLFVWGS